VSVDDETLDTSHPSTSVSNTSDILPGDIEDLWEDVTGTRDRLACMPVDQGKSWEPAHIFLISSRTVSI